MTAALDNDNYKSRLSITNNGSCIKIIDRLVDDACSSPAGKYQIEWKIKDGVIQDISMTSPWTEKPVFSQSGLTSGVDIQNLHKQTLINNWHGRVVIDIDVDVRQVSVMSATKIQNFRPGS